jgi:hypothetical protein
MDRAPETLAHGSECCLDDLHPILGFALHQEDRGKHARCAQRRAVPRFERRDGSYTITLLQWAKLVGVQHRSAALEKTGPECIGIISFLQQSTPARTALCQEKPDTNPLHANA